MRINDLPSQSYATLTITDLENALDVYIDRNQNYIFNLNKTLVIDINEDDLDEYTLTHDMHWPLISYKIYTTTRLAWLLMKLNKVDAKNIFDKKYVNDKIKYLSPQMLNSLISRLAD